jgi:nuclear pore complex protein Nup107
MVPQKDLEFKCDAVLSQNLIEESPSLQELLAVRQWLEQTAPDFEPCDISVGHLQFTRDQISKNSRILGSVKSTIVSELDPDAPTRQKKSLAAEDTTFQQSLNKTIFQYIRRGQLNEAIEFCKSCKLYWKAASLCGGILHYDPQFEENSSDLASQGNQNRTLWKATALALASDDSLDSFERASYAVLAGDIRNTLPACKTWEDHLWAHITCLMEHKIQQKLYSAANMVIQLPQISLPIPSYPHSQESIFDKLLNHEDVTIRETTLEIFHSFQMHFIMNEIDIFFVSMQEQLASISSEECGDEELKHGLRFLTHVIILLRHMELDVGSPATNFIVQRYIELLQIEGKHDLIALYYEFLPGDDQVHGYSSFLSTIQDNKSFYYQLGLDHGLDMLRISERTVSICSRNLMDQDLPLDIPSLEMPDLDAEMEESDIIMINSLEWLGFEDNQIPCLIDFSNSIMRRYLSRFY